MLSPRPLGGGLEREAVTELAQQWREQDERAAEDDRAWHARKHFPHLSPSVAPRESDEYPTYWEGQ